MVLQKEKDMYVHVAVDTVCSACVFYTCGMAGVYKKGFS